MSHIGAGESPKAHWHIILYLGPMPLLPGAKSPADESELLYEFVGDVPYTFRVAYRRTRVQLHMFAFPISFSVLFKH